MLRPSYMSVWSFRVEGTQADSNPNNVMVSCGIPILCVCCDGDLEYGGSSGEI